MNGDQVIAQSKAAADLRTTVTTGKGLGGVRYTCTVQMDENGRSVLEQWDSSYGLSAGSLQRQWRTLTYAFVPKKAFEWIPDASTRAGHESGHYQADGSLNASAQARDCSRAQAPTAESFPDPANCFGNSPSTEGYPFLVQKRFLDTFWRGGTRIFRIQQSPQPGVTPAARLLFHEGGGVLRARLRPSAPLRARPGEGRAPSCVKTVQS